MLSLLLSPNPGIFWAELVTCSWPTFVWSVSSRSLWHSSFSILTRHLLAALLFHIHANLLVNLLMLNHTVWFTQLQMIKFNINYTIKNQVLVGIIVLWKTRLLRLTIGSWNFFWRHKSSIYYNVFNSVLSNKLKIRKETWHCLRPATPSF